MYWVFAKHCQYPWGLCVSHRDRYTIHRLQFNCHQRFRIFTLVLPLVVAGSSSIAAALVTGLLAGRVCASGGQQFIGWWQGEEISLHGNNCAFLAGRLTCEMLRTGTRTIVDQDDSVSFFQAWVCWLNNT